ncbi:alpha-ketoglutarate-dependent dioxygenase AlkB [Salmonella enterica subsp. enterica]|nr:alpha-ketoglutarate-dependent dioxygenase AlkB [Salmonella enterica subsp. enterica]
MATPGAKLSPHQDKDEPDLRARLSSQFRWGCWRFFSLAACVAADPLQRILLEHGGDIVVRGESRLFYHGIQPLKVGHPMTGEFRYTTFRQAVEKECKNKNYYCCAGGVS